MSGYVSSKAIRQNYNQETEKKINDQINLHLRAFYTYLSMSTHYARVDVALPNFSDYFKKAADKEYNGAQELMKHQNSRGGKVVFDEIIKPEQDEWGTGLEGLQSALDLKQTVNKSLLELRAIADSHTSDFIDGSLLREQVDAIKELTAHICNLHRVGKIGHGEYHFEHESM